MERGPTGKLQIPPEIFYDPNYGIDRIVHSKDFNDDIKLQMAEPWIVFSGGNTSHLESDNLLTGKAVLLTADHTYMHEINEGKCY